MTKHVRKGAKVDATEVTESNFDSVAKKVDASVYTDTATGARYMIVEHPERGSSRAEVGGYIVVAEGKDGVTGYRTAADFEADFDRA